MSRRKLFAKQLPEAPLATLSRSKLRLGVVYPTSLIFLSPNEEMGEFPEAPIENVLWRNVVFRHSPFC